MEPKFVLALGDNFYPSGVLSTSDRRFKSHWQDVFLCHPGLRIPWQMCLGNHDYEGNPQAQIDYTTCAHNPDNLWQCPANTYTFSRTLPGGGSVDFFALDTNGCQESVRYDYPNAAKNLQMYITDLQDKLHASTAAWKIVFGHHPVHNHGVRDLTEGQMLREQYGLERVLVSGGAQAYFCGHEHAFQHHTVSGVDYFGCGASDAVGLGCYGGIKSSSCSGWLDESQAGYVEVSMTECSMHVSFVSLDGHIIRSCHRTAH